MKDFPLPDLKWTRGVDEDGTAWVKLDSDKLPIEVFGWTADTRNNTRCGRLIFLIFGVFRIRESEYYIISVFQNIMLNV